MFIYEYTITEIVAEVFNGIFQSSDWNKLEFVMKIEKVIWLE